MATKTKRLKARLDKLVNPYDKSSGYALYFDRAVRKPSFPTGKALETLERTARPGGMYGPAWSKLHGNTKLGLVIRSLVEVDTFGNFRPSEVGWAVLETLKEEREA